MMLGDLLRRIGRADRQRAGFLGEHWATLGAGAALLRWAARSRSPLVRLAAIGGGALLVYRAAAGRDGLMQRRRF